MPSIRPDRSLVVMLFGFAVVIGAVLMTFWLYQGQRRSLDWVNHTLQVEGQLSTILSRVQAAEASQRGFMLTRDPDFLVPYEDARAHVGADIGRLQRLVQDNPEEMRSAARLNDLVAERMERLAIGIARRRDGEPVDPNGFRPGLGLMADIRSEVTTMRRREENLLQMRGDEAGKLTTMVGAGLVGTTAAIILFGLFSLFNARRRLGDAITARDMLADANERLQTEAAERQAAEAQLRQAQKMESIGQLTGGIAHDFNNMLAIVIGSLDMARRRLPQDIDARVAQGIDNATEGAQRAAQLTARLLAFSRQQPLEPQTLDVNKLVGGMSELLRRTLGEQVRVETVLAGGLWRTHIDPGQLESAIVNLCVNARDAMPDGGMLTIETVNAHLDDVYAAAHTDVVAGQYVMVSVTDTGTGMPQEVIERAFDPFYTTKGVGKGTGLGLSQVFGFVKQSHGHVKIYSEPGQGTTIKLYLPRFYGAEAAVGTVAQQPGEDMPRARGEEIVLVVEDEDRVRHVSVDALRDLGYTVVQASDANQALAVLAIQPRIDLLFTDVIMPGMNGRQLAEKVRAERPGIKVLYTTGYTRNAIVHNGMLDPGVAFLPKPFTTDQLAVKVRQVLDSES